MTRAHSKKRPRTTTRKSPTTRASDVRKIDRQVDGLITATAHLLLDVTDPFDAELFGAAIVASGQGEVSYVDMLVDGLIPAIERRGGTDGLAFLLALGSVAPEPASAGASAAAQRLVASGLTEPAWAAALTAPVVVGECLRLSDEDGDAAMLVGTFDRAGGASRTFLIAVNHLNCGAADDIVMVYDDELAAALDIARESVQRMGQKVVEMRLEPADWRWYVEQALDARQVHDDDWLLDDPRADEDDGPGYHPIALLLRARLRALPESSRPRTPHSAWGRSFATATTAATATATDAVYQVKVSLRGAKPPIWRRLEVPSDVDLGELHAIIQVAFGWRDSHLHAFTTPFATFGNAEDDLDEESVTLAEVAPGVGGRLRYTYDFGDSWEHEIVVEKELTPDPTATYPRCTGGRRACPPEDCGGIWGYEMLIDSLRDPRHPEHRENLEWLGLDSSADFDPERFDPSAVTKTLARLS